MANIMLQYDRPTDTRNWTEYNGRVRDWIARLVQTPGAVSFIAYRTADGASPNTIAVLEFRTLDEAKKAAASDHLKAVLEELRATRGTPRFSSLNDHRSPRNRSGLRHDLIHSGKVGPGRSRT